MGGKAGPRALLSPLHRTQARGPGAREQREQLEVPRGRGTAGPPRPRGLWDPDCELQLALQ